MILSYYYDVICNEKMPVKTAPKSNDFMEWKRDLVLT